MRAISICGKFFGPQQANANEILADCFMAFRSPWVPDRHRSISSYRVNALHRQHNTPETQKGIRFPWRLFTLKKPYGLESNFDVCQAAVRSCCVPDKRIINIAATLRNTIVTDSSFL
jgi:hypothetical protein